MNTMNGYAKTTLSDNYVLTSAGGHSPALGYRNYSNISNGEEWITKSWGLYYIEIEKFDTATLLEQSHGNTSFVYRLYVDNTEGKQAVSIRYLNYETDSNRDGNTGSSIAAGSEGWLLMDVTVDPNRSKFLLLLHHESSTTSSAKVRYVSLVKFGEFLDWTVNPSLASTEEFIVGTQTAATGSWTGVTKDAKLYNGKRIVYWLPYNGSGNASLNLTLSGSTSSETGAIAVYRYGTTRVTTHYPAGSAIRLIYLVGANIKGTAYTGWWVDADYADGNTYPSAYCSTDAATAAKTATCTNYTLTAKTYLHLLITNSNTSLNALTLNVNGKGAKPIYINGVVSSNTNYTLPAGSYITYYDGTNYHIRTDGDIPGSISKLLGYTASNFFTAKKVTEYTVDIDDSDNWYYLGTFSSLQGYSPLHIHVSGISASMFNTCTVMLSNLNGWSWSKLVLCGVSTNTTSLTTLGFYLSGGTGVKVYAYIKNSKTTSYAYTGYKIKITYNPSTFTAASAVTKATSSEINSTVLLEYSNNVIYSNLTGDTKSQNVKLCAYNTNSEYGKLYITKQGTACTTSGTAGTIGETYLILGNSTSVSSTLNQGAHNSRGILRLYGSSSGYTNILCGTNNTSAYLLYLPGATGLLVYHDNDTAVGNSTTPVYVDATGLIVACDSKVKRLVVNDVRDTDHLPSSDTYPDCTFTPWFNSTGTPTSAWYSGFTIKGWTDSYQSWLLASGSTLASNPILYYRNGRNDAWEDWKLIAFISDINTTSFPGLNKTGTVTSITLTQGDGITISNSGTAITSSGTRTISNAGVRSVTIGTGDNANKLAVNTNGTTAYLTIPYATTAGSADYIKLSTSLTTEVNISSTGLRAYSGIGSGWTGSITSMQYAAILSLGGPSRGFLIWASRGESINNGLKFRLGNADGDDWYTEKTLLDSANYSSYISHHLLGQGYGTCATAAATTEKAVTLSNYNLSTGGIVSVRFTYGVPANATMNINSKGAKAIRYRNSSIVANIINAGDTATFIYDGTYYHLISIDKGNASLSTYGYMSASDKLKLDAIAENADNVSISRNLTSGTKIGTITINGTGTDLYCLTNTDTKVNVTLGTTTKAYLLATSTTPTSIALAVTSISDTSVYLGTTSGALHAKTFRRYDGSTANTTPLLHAMSNNTDITILRASYATSETYNTSASYGFSLNYAGTGGGNANYLKLLADNQTGTQVLSLCIDLLGNVGIGAENNNAYKLLVNGTSSFNDTINISMENYTHTVYGDENGNLILGGSEGIVLDNGTIVNYDITPSSTNSIDLGTSSLKWANVYATTFNGKLAYTNLTGSTTTANLAIVSNGTANGWTLKTLGSNAFNSTAYLPLTGGTVTGLITLGGTYDKTIKFANTDYAGATAIACMAGSNDFLIRHTLVSTGDTTDLRFNNERLSYSKNLIITGSISAQGGKFYTDANGAYWTSDRRFKKNIHSPVKSGLLKDETGFIRKFDWKETGKASYGYIAQELLLLIPEAVDYDEKLNKYSVNYNVAHSAAIALLVIKIKELELEIKSLKLLIN